MLSPQALIKGIVQRYLPPFKLDSTDQDVPVRLSRDGALFTPHAGPNDIGYTDEGSAFLIATPTIGTGLVQVAAQTAFSSTAPNVYIFNGEPVGGKTIYPRFMKLITTHAMTSATIIRYAGIIDAFRGFSGTNYMDWFASSGAAPYVSAVAPPIVTALNQTSPLPQRLLVGLLDNSTAQTQAATTQNSVVVMNGTWGGINVAGDVFTVTFGQYDGGVNPALTAADTGQPGVRGSTEPPIAIPPQMGLSIYWWSGSSSASFAPEFQMVCVAR